MMNTSSNDSFIPNNNGSNYSGYSTSSVTDIIQLLLFLFTIFLAVAYTALILIRQTFRNNKLNWFTINVCITDALLSIVMILMTMKRLKNLPSILSCRIEGFLIDMSACQLMYSHCVAAFSRMLTIVYANKHIFRSSMCLWSCIGSGWFISILVTLPYLFANGFTCATSDQATFLPYYTLVNTFLLPILIIAICNIWVLVYVRKSSRRVHTENGGTRISQARDIRLLRTLMGTFFIFTLGWAPVFLTQAFNQNNAIPFVINQILQVLPSWTMLNDIILLIYTNIPVRRFLIQLVVRTPVIEANKTGRDVY